MNRPGGVAGTRQYVSCGSARTIRPPAVYARLTASAHVLALTACLLAASMAQARWVEDPTDLLAPPAKRTVTPVRVEKGLNLGDACERYYPLSSRLSSEHGATTLLAFVDVDGRVTETRVETGSGYVALDEAAERCIAQKGRFTPQLVDGTPVGSWQRLKFNWRLDNPARSAAADSLLTAYSKGDYPRLARLLVPYANDGAIDAQIMLARMYLHGTGVREDAAQGATWMRKAAEQGSTVAEYQAGVLSEAGIGVPKDYAAAANWFRKAAHQRHAEAAFNLALLYQSGLGVERDPAMALRWIDAAIEYLAPVSAELFGRGYAATRDSILAGLSPGQAELASGIESPDAPVVRGYFRNRKVVEKAADAAYPARLGVYRGLRTVYLLVFVRADGHADDIRMESSSGLPKLDEATTRVLSQAEYIPRMVAGRAVDAWQLVTWTWALH
jgi:TonB family protein